MSKPGSDARTTLQLTRVFKAPLDRVYAARTSAAQGKIVDPVTTLIFSHVTGSQRLCMSILYERRYRGGGLPA